MAEQRLENLMHLMGPTAGRALIGAQTDLARCQVQAQQEQATLSLSVANRWATLSPISVKGTFLDLAGVFLTEPRPSPPLISLEEHAAREAAHQIVYKYERGLEAGAKALEGLSDVESIVKTLAEGVQGSGAYRNVTYQVPKAKKLLPRVVELLKWTDTGKVTVNPVPETVSGRIDGKALMTELKEGEGGTPRP